MVENKEHILYCDCVYYDFVSLEAKKRIIGAVKGSGHTYSIVPDLCKLCAEADVSLSEWTSKDKLTIIACYPRAVRWLFYGGGEILDLSRVEFFNIRHESEIKRLLQRPGFGSDDTREEENVEVEPSGEWIPWFPVIDYSRCINCQKCLDFCLFGTYGFLIDDEVEVENPWACKTNCPACARICPQKAIIFPKHDSAPINGAPIGDDSETEEVGIDHERLLQGDIYAKLKNRGKGKRFSKDAPSQGRMEELRRELGIPPDVIANLSPAEIAHVRERLSNDEESESDGKGEGNCAG